MIPVVVVLTTCTPNALLETMAHQVKTDVLGWTLTMITDWKNISLGLFVNLAFIMLPNTSTATLTRLTQRMKLIGACSFIEAIPIHQSQTASEEGERKREKETSL